MKILKRILITVGIILGVFVLLVGGYLLVIILSYNRIGTIDLEPNNRTSKEVVEVDQELSAVSYNIGFGAYSQDFTFFMDTGYDEEGKETCGTKSWGKNKEEINTNINGSISTLKEINPDFMMIQEVDTNSTRSYGVNQRDIFTASFETSDFTFAVNFHTMFLPYPLYQMHGIVNGGLLTLSNYKIKQAKRVEYTVSSSLSKLFDLDRCFTENTIDVANGKKLHIINSHLSAYDEGGLIRKQQFDELNAYLKSYKESGDYVIVGGDFNHDLLTNNPDFTYTETSRPFGMTLKDPDWVSQLFDKDGNSPLESGFKVVASDNKPTCRNNDIEWIPEKTYVCVVDGFIVSENIDVIEHYNVETKMGNKNVDGFAFSDHQPAFIKFKLL